MTVAFWSGMRGVQEGVPGLWRSERQQRRRLFQVLRFLIPRVTLPQAGQMLLFGLAGAVIAGAYGVLHDQMTFTVGPEYFTKFKVYQFEYHDDPGPARWVAAKIGFQASWWVGFFAGWFLARLAVPRVPLPVAARLCARGVLGMLAVTLVSGGIAWATVSWRLDEAALSWWTEAVRGFNITDVRAFAEVGYIHEGSYLGALVGLIGAGIWVRRRCGKLDFNR